jgi:hypothetical protein
MTTSLDAGSPFEGVHASEFAGEINTKSKLEKSRNQKIIMSRFKGAGIAFLGKCSSFHENSSFSEKRLTNSYKYLVKISKP